MVVIAVTVEFNDMPHWFVSQIVLIQLSHRIGRTQMHTENSLVDKYLQIVTSGKRQKNGGRSIILNK